MNKQEITTNQNNDQTYQEYYERKRIAMVMEGNNNSKIIAIPSLNKNAKDEWLKLGGNSAYFYKYFVAPRLNKKPPTIHQDTDLNHRFKSGIIAVHWKDAFIKNMKSLKLEPIEESGLLIFQLHHKYTKAEIKKLHVKGAKKKGDLDAWAYLPTSKSLFNQPAGQGIVIGNLTSQLLSNIYLDLLDHFITLDLGYKHYGRYVDDFFIVVRENQLGQLKKDIHAIEEYLSFIGLTLHPKKRVLKESKYGIPFLGATVYHDHITPGKRLIKNAKRAMQEVVSGARTIDSVPSYLGHFKYFNSYNILKEIFDETGWDYIPDDLFRTNFQKTRKSPESDDFLFPYLN